MQILSSFSDLKSVLENNYILQYLEFDDKNVCYFVLDHAIPFFNDEEDSSPIFLLNAKDGSRAHSFKKEKDLLDITIQEIGEVSEITIMHKSNYYYKIFFKKI